MDDPICEIVIRLAGIRSSLGERAFDKAAHLALHSIGQVALEEAEARAGSLASRIIVTGTVVPFRGKPVVDPAQ